MFKLRTLLRAVVGLPTKPTIEGRPLPASCAGWKVIAIVHDRRLSAGVFEKRRGKKPPMFRLVAWRTYRDAQQREQATTNLFRDELDPAVRLLEQVAARIPVTQ